MRRITNLGGVAASIVLIAFGIGALVMGIDGRATVNDTLAQEQIVGTPDMTPAAIRAEVSKAGLDGIEIPTSSVAGEKVDTTSEARTFSEYMRIHALLATDGQVYAEMPRFVDESGKPTHDEQAAAKDPKTGAPAENQARNIWVTETALATALNTSYFADRVGLFSIIVGIALILTGAGFAVVTTRLLLRGRDA